MLRGALIGVLAIGLVCTVTLSLIGWAAPGRPDTTGGAPAPTPPPAAAGSTPDVASLLKAAGLSYTQSDPSKPSYRVMVDVGNAAAIVLVDELTANWKYPDGGPVKIAHMYTQISPFYTQDNPPTTALMRTALEENCNMWFTFYNIDTNQKTGEWSIWLDSHCFLRGMQPEVFKDYFLMLAGGNQPGKDKLLPLVKAK